MSLMHNGHYIAATFSAFLSTITAHLGSIPWEIGCTLARWQHSLNVAIKKAGHRDIGETPNHPLAGIQLQHGYKIDLCATSIATSDEI